MAFSIIASIVLLIFLVTAVVMKNQFRLVSIFIGFFSVGGIYFVWDSEMLNTISRIVGIGRGADLLLYIWVLVTLAVILVLFLRIRLLEESITKLARHIALNGALVHETDKSHE